VPWTSWRKAPSASASHSATRPAQVVRYVLNQHARWSDGRPITWRGFADAWPEREGEFADKFNQMPKYVVSESMDEAEWENSTVVGGTDLGAAVAKMKADHEGDVVVHGSATLAQALLDQGLVDELRLMVFPVVLGSGKRLFDDSGKKPLKLADSRTVGDGVAILVYEPA